MSTHELPPANWYPDPDGADRSRFWDGSAWTDRYYPVHREPGRIKLAWDRVSPFVMGLVASAVIMSLFRESWREYTIPLLFLSIFCIGADTISQRAGTWVAATYLGVLVCYFGLEHGWSGAAVIAAAIGLITGSLFISRGWSTRVQTVVVAVAWTVAIVGGLAAGFVFDWA